jgi:hypothetical protein
VTRLPKGRRCASPAAALRLAGVGLCGEAKTLPPELLMPWEPRAGTAPPAPRTREARPSAKRRRTERGAGKGMVGGPRRPGAA